MKDAEGRSCFSFPISVVYLPESGKIRVVRRTERPFSIEISPDPFAPDGHAELYSTLLDVFIYSVDPDERPFDLN